MNHLRAYPSPNLYAELGSTWRRLMTKPVEAAHAMGKLLKHLGEDRVLYGSDCIWYGSPQEQITALRAFQIPQSMQDQFGYPPLTDQAKKKILGLNAARIYGVDVAATRCKIAEDEVAKLKSASLDGPAWPTLKHHGPRTRREFLAFMRSQG